MKHRRKTAKSTAATKPAGKASPELSTAIKAIAGAAGRKTGPTLAKVRAALQRSGMTWSREGELLFPQDRTALLIEIDEFIEIHGALADALALVSRRKS